MALFPLIPGIHATYETVMYFKGLAAGRALVKTRKLIRHWWINK